MYSELVTAKDCLCSKFCFCLVFQTSCPRRHFTLLHEVHTSVHHFLYTVWSKLDIRTMHWTGHLEVYLEVSSILFWSHKWNNHMTSSLILCFLHCHCISFMYFIVGNEFAPMVSYGFQRVGIIGKWNCGLALQSLLVPFDYGSLLPRGFQCA